MVQGKCAYCGNCFHWCEAFAKFGYDDGDGQVHTQAVAEILEGFGYKVKYSRWGHTAPSSFRLGKAVLSIRCSIILNL